METGSDLVSRLLSASRRQQLQPASVDIAELLQRTAALLRRTLPQNISIDVKIECFIGGLIVGGGGGVTEISTSLKLFSCECCPAESEINAIASVPDSARN